jgi:hypothetical protein
MAGILALFAVAPAADPKSLLGAIDVPCKMSGDINFFNFENSIFKFILFFPISNFLKKKHYSKATVNLNPKLSPFPLAGQHRRHEGLARLQLY